MARPTYKGYSKRRGFVSRDVMARARRNARSYNRRAFRSAYTSAGTRYSRILSSIPPRMAEVKSVDLALTQYLINSTGVVTPLNLIQVGSTFCNRIGRRIEMKSLYMTGFMKQTAFGTTFSDYARIMVIYDRQTNGATPTVATILANYDQTTAATTNSSSGINPDQRERFVILCDERRTMPPVDALANGTSGPFDGNKDILDVKRFIKLGGLATHYQADSSPSVVGDISTGGLFLLTIGSFANGAQPFNAQLNFRLRYSDT